MEDGVAGRWTKEEHERFLEALKIHGRDWKKVQLYVGTRTTTQTRSHAQKYFAKTSRQPPDADSSLPPTAVNSPLSKSDSVQEDQNKPIRKRKKHNKKKEESKNPRKMKIIENGIMEELPLASQLQIESIEQNFIPAYSTLEQMVYSVQDDLVSAQGPEEVDFDFDIVLPETIRPLELPNNSLHAPFYSYEETPISFDFSNINW